MTPTIERSRVVVAMDGFKGVVGAALASRYVAQGLRLGLTDRYEVVEIPVCDGGGGFCDLLVAAREGLVVRGIPAHDAAMRPIDDCKIGLIEDARGCRTGVIESADSIGLARIDRAPKPKVKLLDRTSYGLGEVISAIAKYDVHRIIIGLGDSAVVDAGIGMLAAMGAEVLDVKGDLLRSPTARHLSSLRSVKFNRPGWLPPLELACNLSSTLTNSGGRYGKQKDLHGNSVGRLDKGVRAAVRVYAEAFGVEIGSTPGGGGSGGVGAALIAGLGAMPRYSFRVVDEVCRLRERLAGACVVVVGEGMLDASTARGKAPGAVAMLASALGARVAAIGGAVRPHCFGRLTSLGIDAIQTLTDPDQRLERYLDPSHAAGLLRDAGARIAPIVAMLATSAVRK